MLKCLIIEDDVNMARSIAETLQKHQPMLDILPLCHTIDEVKLALSTQNPDLVISDINLGDELVFSVLENLSEINFKVIFITAYSKYAVECFKFSAIDFLEKPFSDKALLTSVNTAIASIKEDNYNTQLEAFFFNFKASRSDRKLVVKTVDTVYVIPVSTINYIKSDNNYSEIYTNDGQTLVASKPLKFYDEQLRDYGFFRSHQSYLINLNRIASIQKKDSVVHLRTGEKVPVSGTKQGALVHKLEQLNN